MLFANFRLIVVNPLLWVINSLRSFGLFLSFSSDGSDLLELCESTLGETWETSARATLAHGGSAGQSSGVTPLKLYFLLSVFCGRSDERQDHWQEHKAVEESKDHDSEETLEEQAEEV